MLEGAARGCGLGENLCAVGEAIPSSNCEAMFICVRAGNSARIRGSQLYSQLATMLCVVGAECRKELVSEGTSGVD